MAPKLCKFIPRPCGYNYDGGTKSSKWVQPCWWKGAIVSLGNVHSSKDIFLKRSFPPLFLQKTREECYACMKSVYFWQLWSSQFKLKKNLSDGEPENKQWRLCVDIQGIELCNIKNKLTVGKWPLSCSFIYVQILYSKHSFKILHSCFLQVNESCKKQSLAV